MKPWLAAFLLVGVVACGDDDAPDTTTTTTVAETTTTTVDPGEATQTSVLEDIRADTDCVSLQETFERAADAQEREPAGSALSDAYLDRMEAVIERQEELGC